MEQYGPIIFIDGDLDDQYIYQQLMSEIAPQHELICFQSGQQAIDFLSNTDKIPFLIISEVSMNGMNGLELRSQIERDPALRKRSIPFIFLTHPIYKQLVEQAYDLTIQGFFEKKNTMNELRTQLESIITYWSNCLHPNRLIDNY